MSTATFHRACELILAHCPLDTAREFARCGTEEWEPDRQVSLAQFLHYETRNWRTPLGLNVRRTLAAFKAGRGYDQEPPATLRELGLEG